MRILLLADVEDPRLTAERFDRRLFDGIDLVVSCGDLPAGYLSDIATLQPHPVAYVPGNHDSSYAAYPPEGCVCLDDKLLDFHGLRLMGLGGSVWYRDGAVCYTEAQMARRCARMTLLAQAAGGVDVVVTHAPVAGYGDLDDRVHAGFACFGRLLQKLGPSVLVHGHVHLEYGRVGRELVHSCGTRIVNACGAYTVEVEPGARGRALFAPPRL